MASSVLIRPEASEYPEYFGRYVALAKEGPLLEQLQGQMARFDALLAGVPTAREEYRYAPDKWSIREVVGHVTDHERVFAFRALWFSRADPAVQPGMDENHWMSTCGALERSLTDHREEFRSVRQATISLAAALTETQALRRGRATSGEFTVRGMLAVAVGHVEHHMRVLQERYRLRGSA